MRCIFFSKLELGVLQNQLSGVIVQALRFCRPRALCSFIFDQATSYIKQVQNRDVGRSELLCALFMMSGLENQGEAYTRAWAPQQADHPSSVEVHFS